MSKDALRLQKAEDLAGLERGASTDSERALLTILRLVGEVSMKVGNPGVVCTLLHRSDRGLGSFRYICTFGRNGTVPVDNVSRVGMRVERFLRTLPSDCFEGSPQVLNLKGAGLAYEHLQRMVKRG